VAGYGPPPSNQNTGSPTTIYVGTVFGWKIILLYLFLLILINLIVFVLKIIIEYKTNCIFFQRDSNCASCQMYAIVPKKQVRMFSKKQTSGQNAAVANNVDDQFRRHSIRRVWMTTQNISKFPKTTDF
jgi:uncharacterized membrane protein YraQ (UPF0718 family)